MKQKIKLAQAIELSNVPLLVRITNTEPCIVVFEKKYLKCNDIQL